MPQNPAETRSAEKPTEKGISHTKSAGIIDRRISVAPMMDWTDRHCRYFLRGFSASALLYTEMIPAAAILRGDRERFLAFSPEEQPVALQLGGSDPQELAAAARAGEEAGYAEVNLNCGCPSERVASGAFGACLMREPARVAACVAAMRATVRVPVTVKMRIGVVTAAGTGARAASAAYEEEDFAALCHFVTSICDAGCAVAIVHARKAVLGAFSPKDNREIPPLRYEVVRRLKETFPALSVIVNGGLRDADAIGAALGWCDGVMLGREAYHRPYLLAELEERLHPGSPTPDRAAVIARMQRYAERELAAGTRLSAITRHMLGLYNGEPGAREYRRVLSEGARVADAGPDLIYKAMPRSTRVTAAL